MRRHQSAPGLRLHLHSSSEMPAPAALALTELLAPDHLDGSEKAKVSLTLGEVRFAPLWPASLVLTCHSGTSNDVIIDRCQQSPKL